MESSEKLRGLDYPRKLWGVNLEELPYRLSSDGKTLMAVHFRTHWIPALVALFIVAPLVWWIADREPPYTLSDGLAIPNPAKPGQELAIQWTIDVKRTGCIGYFQRILIDSSRHVWTYQPMQSGFVGLPVGRHVTHSIWKFAIPVGVSLGPAEVFTVTTYQCNPIHRLWPIIDQQPHVHLMIEDE